MSLCVPGSITFGTLVLELTPLSIAGPEVEIVACSLRVKIVGVVIAVLKWLPVGSREAFFPQVIVNHVPRSIRLYLFLKSKLHIILVSYWKSELPNVII